MAAVHLHNALFTPPSTPGGSGDTLTRRPPSLTSTTSGITSSDMRSFSRFLTGNQSYLPTLETDVQPGRSIHHDCKWTRERRLQKSLRIWSYARLVLSVAVVLWVVYCTARYFVALRVYGGDPIRSRYALGMGITSTTTMLFYASESLLILRFIGPRVPHWIALVVHSLTYLSSVFVMAISLINLVLVFLWRVPHSPTEYGRSIQGRCVWDVDVVWAGTGMVCAQGQAMPFGDWLGAAISRLVLSAVLLVAYHLAVHGHHIAMGFQEASTPFDANTDVFHAATCQNIPDETRHLQEPQMQETPPTTASIVNAIAMSEDEHQRRSLSFTAAGQVLSRIDGSEINAEGEDEEEDDVESPLSLSSEMTLSMNEEVDIQRLRVLNDSPEPFSSSSHSHRLRIGTGANAESDGLPANLPPSSLPPSSFFRPITAPSNDLQDLASAFRSIVTQVTRETREGMDLRSSPRETREVRMFGSYISRMSTIDSMASREVCSSVRSPSRTDTSPSRTDTSPSQTSCSGSPPTPAS